MTDTATEWSDRLVQAITHAHSAHARHSRTPDVVALVEGMTFTSFAEGTRALWERPLEVKLLKLYDKTSNLLDGRWMKTAKWNAYVAHTLRLAAEVERAYGALNIVRIARAIALAR